MNTGAVGKLAWYRNRLQAMSVPETLHRSMQAARMNLERLGLGVARQVPAADLNKPGITLVAAPELNSVEAAPYLARGERVLAGDLVLLGKRILLDAPVNWNRNPVTGHELPLSYGKSLDYRDSQRVGDIKYFWLLNRHHQLVHLAQAYALTGNERYLAGLADMLRSWLEQCPYTRGANWTSSLELAIRLINWSAVWALIGGAGSGLFAGAEGAALRKAWLERIYQHQHFIAGHFSRFSSANNHLIGEAAGLLVAALTWPHWRVCGRWAATAHHILDREVEKQNAPDGVNREQSMFYQHFVLEFMIYAGLAAEAAGRPMREGYWERLKSMLTFVTSMMDVSGGLPMFGDADDALVLPLAPEPGWTSFQMPLSLAAVRFQRPEFKKASRRYSEECRWLLPAGAERDFEILEGASAAFVPGRRFPTGGYYLVGDRFDTGSEVRVTVDAGPLGYTSIAAHGHADALSVCLSVGGHPILIDPGTYAYQADTEWREYFRSTAAHNTLRVDGQSQAVSGGKFLWLRHYRAGCTHWTTGDEEDHLVAWQDGYERLRDPVRHERSVRYRKADKVLEITDRVLCRGVHQIERFWHFHPDVDVQVSGSQLIARASGRRIRMSAEGGVPDARRGSTKPILGWYSPTFGERIPTTTVCWAERIRGTTVRVTRIHIE